VRAALHHLQNHDAPYHPLESWGESWEPEDVGSFAVRLAAWIGDDVEEGGDDLFDFTACTPDRLAFLYQAEFERQRSNDEGTAAVVPLPAVLVLQRWDYRAIWDYLAGLCAATSGDTWQSIGAQLNGTLEWEFAYRLDPGWDEHTTSGS
jgi:Immunity protein 8